jgi:ADP-ribosylation factor GTPase-activating protein 1
MSSCCITIRSQLYLSSDKADICFLRTQLAESDFAARARITASQLGQNIQTGARGAADSFSRFVEGGDERAASLAANRRGPAPERKDFWDDFASIGSASGSGAGNPGEIQRSTPGSLGTAAMRKPPTTGPSSLSSSTARPTAPGSAATGGATATLSAKPEEGGDWKEEW